MDMDAVVEAMVDKIEVIADRVARDVHTEATRQLGQQLDAWAQDVNQALGEMMSLVDILAGRVTELEQQAQDKTAIPISPPGMDMTDEQLVSEIVRRGIAMSTIAKARAKRHDDSSEGEGGEGEGGDGAGSTD